ncbi:dnaJ homolog subfamily C member 5-like [Leucoraja erinacea]|uniref:dnaJ homolog subfamily C member 5-like n=1 Tax=Leucoraja erinaceus TaxID=7782 RepID=UPI002458E13D|nr:dnaJ homolog subfamily C member 5-like [Leucoraja erinacea]
MTNRQERSNSTRGESLYTILHLPRKSSPEEVKAAYRKLALRYHPDKNPDDPSAVELFKEINRAHTILSDEKKKCIYDSYGSAGLHLASMLGEDGENILAWQNNLCMKFVSYFCMVITCCCCCFCCCFCCGKCLTKEEKCNIPEDQPVHADESNPILVQPFTVNRETTPLTQEFEHSQNAYK